MGTALQHDEAAQFLGIQAASTRGSNQLGHTKFTAHGALTYDATTLLTSGT